MASASPNKSTKDDLNYADDQSIRMSGFDELAKMDEDEAVLRANGHAAAMPRQFNWLSALGLGFSITNSWIGYFVSDLSIPYSCPFTHNSQSCFGQNLIYGGAQATIFSLIVAFFCQGIVTLGVGELASAYPVCLN
jgi:choline transport protein